mgnify:CR=1 FL=1
MKIRDLEAIVAAVNEKTSMPMDDIIDAVIPADNQLILSLIEDLMTKEDPPGPKGIGSLRQALVDCIVAWLHQVF